MDFWCCLGCGRWQPASVTRKTTEMTRRTGGQWNATYAFQHTPEREYATEMRNSGACRNPARKQGARRFRPYLESCLPQPLLRLPDRLFFLAKAEPHKLCAALRVFEETRSRHSGNSRFLHQSARELYVVFIAET